MNLAEHALKQLKSVRIVPKKAPPEAYIKMLENKELMQKIITQGGSISAVGKRLGLAHATISRHLDKILGDGTHEKAKENGLHNSARGLKGKDDPKRDLMTN